MPRVLTMATLIERCKRRADLEGDGHVSDPEWRALISEKYGELHGIVSGAGLRYFETAQTITATGAASYTEPSDHLTTIGFDRVETSGARYPLVELMPYERARLAGQTGDAIGYSIVDDQIRLYPNPSSGSYELLYIPQPPDLSSYADGDLVDLVCADGEAFLIWGVSVLAKSKSESDVRLAQEREVAASQRLLEWSVNRSLSQPRRRPEPDWSTVTTNRWGDV